MQPRTKSYKIIEGTSTLTGIYPAQLQIELYQSQCMVNIVRGVSEYLYSKP